MIEMAVFLIADVEISKGREVSEQLANIDQISEVYLLTGEYDLLARIDLEDISETFDLILSEIRAIEGIKETRTIFAERVE